MSDYHPDKWVVVKISGYKDHPKPLYKVFACWYGGWAGSDSWKLNSGITKVTLEGYVYSFEGASGSFMADLKLLIAAPRSPPTFLSLLVPNKTNTIRRSKTNSHNPIPITTPIICCLKNLKL